MLNQVLSVFNIGKDLRFFPSSHCHIAVLCSEKLHEFFNLSNKPHTILHSSQTKIDTEGGSDI